MVSNYFFRNIIRVSNGLDPDQDQQSVGPDLGPNCLKRLSSAEIFNIDGFKNFFQDYHQYVKRFGSRSGSKLFEKVINRRQKLPLARKKLNML